MKKLKQTLVTTALTLLCPLACFAQNDMAQLALKMWPDNILASAPDRVNPALKPDRKNRLQRKVSGGIIEGMDATAKNVEVFKGIPYAAAPTGQRRWKAPQDVEPWQGIRECTVCGPNPIQGPNPIPQGQYGAEMNPDPEVGYSEDCLFLNVWTNGKGKDMPVVFYIPGGAWTGGGCSVEVYNGEYLASQKVVFVSVSYRLGLFGFFGSSVLAEDDPEGSTGNYGMMDLVKALEWVRDNIRQFGGDPDNVTLYGGSAGGNLIDMLMISPKARGLFRRAVSMSYPLDMINPAAEYQVKKEGGDKLLTSRAELDSLRQLSTKDLLATPKAMLMQMSFGPCIDGVYIPKRWAEAVADGTTNGIDYVAGFNFNDEFPNTGDAMFSLFMGIQPEGFTQGDLLRTVYNAVGNARLSAGAKNTYLLQFAQPTPSPKAEGAKHGCDLLYALNYFSPLSQPYCSAKDAEMARIASAYFINFCRTGNPNGKGLPQWSSADREGTSMRMDNGCTLQTVADDIRAKVVDAFEAKDDPLCKDVISNLK